MDSLFAFIIRVGRIRPACPALILKIQLLAGLVQLTLNLFIENWACSLFGDCHLSICSKQSFCGAFDDFDLVGSETVELVDEAVDLFVRGIDLALKNRFFLRGLSASLATV